MSPTAKVGLFALIVLVIAGIFILKIEDLSLGRGKIQRIRVSFPDVSGLDAKAAVRVHGVRVGKVESIALFDDHAEAVLAVDASLKLGKGATAAVRNMGLLGDKYVELMPGDPSAGPPEDPDKLKGTSPIAYDEILEKLASIGTDVKALTASFRASLAGPEAEGKMQEIVENIRAFTAEANHLLAENRGTVKTIGGNIEAITARLREDLPEVLAAARTLLENLDGVVLENRTTLAETVENLKESTARLETTMKSVDSIMLKIDQGEGTIGKLVNSPETHDKLVATMDSVKGGVDTFQDSFGRVRKWDLSLDLHTDYLAETENFLTDFSAWLWPNHGRYYLFEVVSDPIGDRSEKNGDHHHHPPRRLGERHRRHLPEVRTEVHGEPAVRLAVRQAHPARRGQAGDRRRRDGLSSVQRPPPAFPGRVRFLGPLPGLPAPVPGALLPQQESLHFHRDERHHERRHALLLHRGRSHLGRRGLQVPAGGGAEPVGGTAPVLAVPRRG
jgi:phospholipid/cholesterol/gamma-HCH transport system substrate-binding protein